MRVQLLERDASARAQLLTLLHACGHEVDASAERVIVPHLSAAPPDLILVGFDHPSVSDPAVRDWLSYRRAGSGPLVVALAPSGPECDSSLAAAGFDDVIALDAGDAIIGMRLELLARRITGSGEGGAAERSDATTSLQGTASAIDELSLWSTIEQSPDLFWIKDRDLRIVRANTATATRFGLSSPASLVGLTDHDLFAAGDADLFRAREREVIETGVPLAGKLEESTLSEYTTRAVLSTKFPLRAPNGETIGLVGMLRDVTDLIEAQGRVAVNEARFRKLIQHSSDVLVVIDGDARVTWMAPSVERTLGRAMRDRIGKSVFDYVVEEDLPKARAALAATIANPGEAQSVLVRVRAKNGTIRSILNTVTNLLDSEIGGIVLNGRDVTETLEAEDRLRREREYVRLAIESARVAAWQLDLGSYEVVWNPRVAAAFDLSAVETRLGLAEIQGLIHSDDRELISPESIARYVAQGALEIEFRAVWPDGSIHWLKVMGGTSFDLDGRSEMLAGVVFDVTARKEMEAKLHAERAILDNLMNQGPDAVFIKDRNSRFTRVNALIARHFGFKDPAEMIGLTDFDLFPADEAKCYFADEQRVMKSGVPIVNRLDCHKRPAGGDLWILTSLAPIRDERLQVVGVIGTSRDVTHYSLDDRQLAIAEMRYRLVVEQIPAITCLYSIKNDEHAYEYISPQVEEILGFTPEEYVRLWLTEPDSMFHPDDRDRMSGAVERVNANHSAATLEYRHRTKGGGWKWVREVASPLPGDDPDHRRWQGMLFDLTEDRALTERLEHQVFHDALTGLPNRLMLSQRLDAIVAHSERTKRRFALLFIDIDEFKRVNDSKGHQAGDAALISVAERLRELTRTGDTIARLGGDEFVVLLGDISGPRNAYEIAERVQRAFKKPFQIDGEFMVLSPSIGVSIHDPERNTPADMLREADAAMYEAKRAGRGRTRIFEPTPRFPELARSG